MTEKILVTGATGTVGSAVVSALKKRQADFVAASRTAAHAQEKLGADTETVAFDFAQPETYAQATAGVGRVFLLGPPLDSNLDKLLTPFVEHLQQQGIKRVVYLSAFGAEKMPDFHTKMEKMLQEKGFDLTILRPSFFAQNFKNYEWENITERKIIYVAAGQGKAAFVDILDVGEVAAKVLLGAGHTGKEYILTGPENLGYEDAAQLLTEIRKEPVHYPAPSPETYAQTLKEAGAPDFIAPYMNKVYGLIREGHAAYVSPDTEKLLGRPPGTLKAVLERDFR